MLGPAGLETSGRVGHTVHFTPATETLPASIYVIGGFRDVDGQSPSVVLKCFQVDNGSPRTTAAQNFNLAVARGDHASALLPDGRILISGDGS